MTQSAPGRFSTTTGCAHRTDKRCAKSLAVKSAALPAGTGRMKCTARSGQALAELHKETDAAATNSKPEIIRTIDVSPSPILLSACAGRHLGEYISHSRSQSGT